MDVVYRNIEKIVHIVHFFPHFSFNKSKGKHFGDLFCKRPISDFVKTVGPRLTDFINVRQACRMCRTASPARGGPLPEESLQDELSIAF